MDDDVMDDDDDAMDDNAMDDDDNAMDAFLRCAFKTQLLVSSNLTRVRARNTALHSLSFEW